jgi:hypothetical protein
MARKKLSDKEIDNALTDLKGWKIRNGNLYKRFTFQNFTEALLPDALKNSNPQGILRLVNDTYTRESVEQV